MVLQRLASFICNFVGIPRPPSRRTKQVVSLYEDNKSGCVPEGGEGLGAGSDCSSSPDGEEPCLCSVCLSGLKGNEDVRVLPCTHRFHGQCIDRWLSGLRVRTCPVCRFKVDGGGREAESRRWEELTEDMAIWFSSFHVAGF